MVQPAGESCPNCQSPHWDLRPVFEADPMSGMILTCRNCSASWFMDAGQPWNQMFADLEAIYADK